MPSGWRLRKRGGAKEVKSAEPEAAALRRACGVDIVWVIQGPNIWRGETISMSPINRREFLRKSTAGLASIPALAAISCSTTPQPTAPIQPAAPVGPPLGLPIGLELYTVRDQCEKDFEGTLKQIAAIGYQTVEIYDFYGKTAADVKKLLDDNGLKAPAGHWLLPKLRNSLPKCIDDAKTLGCEYLVMPILDPPERKTFGQFKRHAEFFNKVGEKCKQAGLSFGYHNHNYEFKKYDDTTVFDYLLSALDPQLVSIEMDCFWVVHAGYDPVTYLEKYPGRFPILHIKDLKAGYAPTTEKDDKVGLFAEVGHGTIDWKRIFTAAPKGGMKCYFVEQDFFERPPLESVKMSYDYLKKLAV
ncbi:MAG: sugar phosphate isomerase/epimerase [Acidobacteriia bacterium]|nr:sugar phosphate isomerase/epimerase [Terriglobia bacterium]